jgi:hypothetical protein
MRLDAPVLSPLGEAVMPASRTRWRRTPGDLPATAGW